MKSASNRAEGKKARAEAFYKTRLVYIQNIYARERRRRNTLAGSSQLQRDDNEEEEDLFVASYGIVGELCRFLLAVRKEEENK